MKHKQLSSVLLPKKIYPCSCSRIKISSIHVLYDPVSMIKTKLRRLRFSPECVVAFSVQCSQEGIFSLTTVVVFQCINNAGISLILQCCSHHRYAVVSRFVLYAFNAFKQIKIIKCRNFWCTETVLWSLPNFMNFSLKDINLSSISFLTSFSLWITRYLSFMVLQDPYMHIDK